MSSAIQNPSAPLNLLYLIVRNRHILEYIRLIAWRTLVESDAPEARDWMTLIVLAPCVYDDTPILFEAVYENNGVTDGDGEQK